MAGYTVECLPSLCRWGNNWNTSYSQDGISVRDSEHYNVVYKTWIKFYTTSLTNYKRKKILSVYLKYNGVTRYSTSDFDLLGGSIAWMNSTFDENINWTNYPSSNVWFFFYTTSQGIILQQITPYLAGYVGYDGIAAPRSFYDQMGIGFELFNSVKLEEKKGVNWFSTNANSYISVLFNFEDWNPPLTARFPLSSVYVNPFIDNVFSIGFDIFDSIDYPTATQITYEIKDVATSAVTSHDVAMSVNLRNRNYLDIPVPANTLATGKNYQWRAKIITDDGTTDFSAWADFTTLDATPGAPTLIYPQSKYLDGASAITFTWQHNVSTGSTQHAYDLQYKQTGDWISLVSHFVSSAQSYTVAANTFEAGQMYWRVRTYNIDNVAGSYGTSAANVVQAKPVTPIINGIIGTPRGTVYWQSVGQQAYEVILKDLNGNIIGQTGAVFGAARSQTAYAFIPNGNYVVYLRIQNGQGVWSDYATMTVHVENSPPSGDDYLVATPLFGAVKLDITLPTPLDVTYVGESYVGEPYAAHQPYNASGTRYILRDGKPIALITGTTYIDYTCSGEHKYVCRIATSSGNYFDTKPVTASPIIKYACISKFSDPQNVLVLMLNEGSAPKFGNQLTRVYSEHFFAGRKLPVHDETEHYNSSWDYTYSFVRKSDYDALYQLFLDGETVMFRDGKGYKSVGTLANVKPVINAKFISASFTIVETDVNEEIAYV